MPNNVKTRKVSRLTIRHIEDENQPLCPVPSLLLGHQDHLCETFRGGDLVLSPGVSWQI